MSRRPSVVDLTLSSARRRPSAGSISELPSSASSPSSPRRTTRRRSPTSESSGNKRRRVGRHSFSSSSDVAVDEPPIDLTGEADQIRAKQTQDAIQSQKPDDEDKAHSILGAYKCPICMDTPENATSTACGHLFCHQCIIECLNRADDQRVESNKQGRGTCPVCRKPLTKNDASGPKRSLIPLQIKLTTKKRSAVEPAAA